MKEVKIDNLVKFYVLISLYSKPRHGYELIKEIREKMGKKASPGQIYPFLKSLRKIGYVGIRTVEAREKKVYRLTNPGKKFVRIILNRFGSLLEIAVKPQLSICAHCGCSVYRGGHKELIKGKNLVFCCVSCAKEY
ncbi:MAG: PadR family transcriptional regulator [Candidatus Aenigmarchaeota archaeon]|nr:PadR family transcriptional regulator [Candidatus Aenigmarchaeota archaeon]